MPAIARGTRWDTGACGEDGEEGEPGAPPTSTPRRGGSAERRGPRLFPTTHSTMVAHTVFPSRASQLNWLPGFPRFFPTESVLDLYLCLSLSPFPLPRAPQRERDYLRDLVGEMRSRHREELQEMEARMKEGGVAIPPPLPPQPPSGWDEEELRISHTKVSDRKGDVGGNGGCGLSLPWCGCTGMGQPSRRREAAGMQTNSGQGSHRWLPCVCSLVVSQTWQIKELEEDKAKLESSLRQTCQRILDMEQKGQEDLARTKERRAQMSRHPDVFREVGQVLEQ